MAGGKATRLNLPQEKPLLEFDGKPLIEIIVNALKNAGIKRIIVAVTHHTPKTAKHSQKLSVEVLQTHGEGYIEDTQYAIKKLRLGTVIVVSADLPFLDSESVREIVEHFESCGKPALATVAPRKVCDKLNLKVDAEFEFRGEKVVPVGVNIVTGARVNEPELEQEVLIINKPQLAVNVNNPHNLEVARRLFVQEEQFTDQKQKATFAKLIMRKK
jgi:adenosylcobinamide-phosphate guanylyltransferase